MFLQGQIVSTQRFANLPVEVVGIDSQGDMFSVEHLRRFAEKMHLGGCFLTVDHSRTAAPIGRFAGARVEGDGDDALLLADGVLYGTHNYCDPRTVLDARRLNTRPADAGRTDVGNVGPVLVRVASTKRPIAAAAAEALREGGVTVEVGRELKKGLLDVDTLTVIFGSSVLLTKFARSLADGVITELGKRVGGRLAVELVKIIESLSKFLEQLFDIQHVTGKGHATHSNVDLVFRTILGPCQIDAVLPSGTPSSQVPDALQRMATRLFPDAPFLLRTDLRATAIRLVFVWDAIARGWSPAYLVLRDLERDDPAYDLVATKRMPANKHLGKLPVGPDEVVSLSIEAMEFDAIMEDAPGDAVSG
jgi:hypothetical protein